MYLIGIRNKVTGDQFSYEITKEFADFYNVLDILLLTDNISGSYVVPIY